MIISSSDGWRMISVNDTEEKRKENFVTDKEQVKDTETVKEKCCVPLYFFAEGMRVSLVSISSSSEIFSTVVRYSMTRVRRSGRREISKMCSM